MNNTNDSFTSIFRALTSGQLSYDDDNTNVANMTSEGGGWEGAAFNLSSDESRLLLARIAEEYQNQTHWFPTSTVVALVISYCVVIALGLVGNILVVVVMLRRKDLQTSRNFYILNLSVCDILMSSVCMPFSLVKYTVKRWMLGDAMCRIVPALATVDVFVSTFTIIAIATDRYRSIVHASNQHSRHHGYHAPVIISIVVIWLVSIGLAAPLFIFHELSSESVLGKQVFHTCIEVFPHDRFREIYSIFVTLVQYLTPTAVISCLHARICSFLRRRIHDSPTSESQYRRSQREMKRHRKNLVLLSSIAISFSIAWLPLTLLNITADWTHDNSIFGLFSEEQFYLAHAICLLIAMSSSAVNPILYGWYNTNFRNAFLEILCLKRDANPETSSLKGDQDGSGKREGKYDTFNKTPSQQSGSR
ncbi:neuropeptide Y receptor type 2-like [Littorina saxatilis]|uniref:neuropeptide Y receptor type 2-like n=1 Tax=Littorina saxatilis TaxID=31220 RepID=UPI0038B4E7EB